MDPEKPQLPSEEEIAKLSREAQQAYAARCALRVFPLIGSEEHFDFWGDRALLHTRSVFATLAAAGTGTIATAAAAAVDAAILSANVVSYVAKATTAAYTAKATAAAAAAAAATTAAATAATIEASRTDYEQLISLGEKKTVNWVFFERPLFEGTRTSLEDWVSGDVEKAFESVGCRDLLYWWIDFFNGKPPSKEALTKWLKDWDEGIKREDIESFQKIPSMARQTGKSVDFVEDAIEPKTRQEQKEVEPEAVSGIQNLDGAGRTNRDQPTLEDHLNRAGLVESLAQMIEHPEQETPLTIGLFGHWGTGKSSLMGMLQKRLTEDKKDPNAQFLFSWFNCWEYEHSKDIQAGLAQEVVNGLLGDGEFHREERNRTREVSWWEKFKIRRAFILSEKKLEYDFFLLKLFGSLMGVLLPLLSILQFDGEPLVAGISAVALLYLRGLSKQGKHLWDHPLRTELATFFKLPSYRAEIGQIPMIRKQLEGLCKVRLHQGEGEVKRLVVFVDDMDRCSVQTISKAFDAIRLITDIQQVVVIIGIDERVAFKAMGDSYKDYASIEDSRTESDVARDYLGKIIQIPVRLNSPTEEELEGFIQEDLFAREETTHDQPGGDGIQKLEEAESKSEESLDKAEPRREHKLPPEATAAEAREIEESAIRKPKSGVGGEVFSEDEEKVDEMEESSDEIESFCELVKLFGFNNPRQLLRLRNSYRLLKKLIFHQPRKETHFSYQTDNDSLLITLFWWEFRLTNSPSDVHDWCAPCEKLKGKISKSGSKAVKLFEASFLKELKRSRKGTSDPTFEFPEGSSWKSLEDFAKMCVLPFPTKETLMLVSEVEAQRAPAKKTPRKTSSMASPRG